MSVERVGWRVRRVARKVEVEHSVGIEVDVVDGFLVGIVDSND